jgi:hypothetical protein
VDSRDYSILHVGEKNRHAISGTDTNELRLRRRYQRVPFSEASAGSINKQHEIRMNLLNLRVFTRPVRRKTRAEAVTEPRQLLQQTGFKHTFGIRAPHPSI